MPVDADLLRRAPLFQGMTEAAVEAIRSVAAEVDFEAGSTIVAEGEPGECFYVIAEGEARVERGGQVIRDLGAGDFFGEIALLDGAARTATIIATAPVRAIGIRRVDFQRLVDERPVIRFGVIEALTEHLRRDATSAAD